MCVSSSLPTALSRKPSLASLFVFVTLASVAATETIYEAISGNPKLSKFKEYIDKDEVIKVYLDHRTVTVFAPTNDAFDKFQIPKPEYESKIASIHVAGALVTQDIAPYMMTSSLTEAAPLYLGVKHQHHENSHHGSGAQSYFINNAQLGERLDFTSKDNSKQILYIIDEVIEPYISLSSRIPMAMELLRKPDTYDLQVSDSRLEAFANKVQELGLETLFEKAGNHTYFIPINIGENRLREMDAAVIRGHVIPDNVLFRRTMGFDAYKTDTFSDSLQVEVSLVKRGSLQSSGDHQYYIQSNSLIADPLHNKGVVMSKVIRANIPVRNGVVHLIEKPLMIVDSSIWDFVDAERINRLSKFHEILEKVPEVQMSLRTKSLKTVFAPTAKAFEAIQDKLDTLTPEELENLLRLHIVEQAISSDDVKSQRIPEIMSSDNQRKLYFKVVGDDRTVFTVEGGGVNATALQADVSATNGIVHVIDRVLGIPFQTVYEKLSTDPDLSTTFQVADFGDHSWNRDLDKRNFQYTYFVPSNEAWEWMKAHYVSEHKQLTEGILPVHAKQILDRHLVVGHEYMLSDLRSGNDITTKRGTLKVSKDNEQSPMSDVKVSWEGVTATIKRPDVKAINGVIHVIDKVLFEKRDLTVGASASLQVTSLVTIFISSLIVKYVI